jgi:NADP-dependent 3-hydroxy acid dehydrogenase YdfG
MRELQKRAAVVIGASSGIGAATATSLAAAGARVAAGARRIDRLAKLGPRVLPLPLDVRDAASCGVFVEAVVAELGGIDILVNAAGIAVGRAPFTESTEADEQLVLDTNLRGLIRITRLCLPHMRDDGHIVMIGSLAGRRAYLNGAVYVTSKFGLRGFVYALREDLLGRPIQVTTVDPGMVETEFSLARYRGDAERAARVYEGLHALRAEDVADCVMFALTRPRHVNIDEIVVLPLDQSRIATVSHVDHS